MQTILVITAMPEEMALIEYLLPSESVAKIGPFEYRESFAYDNRIISVISGVGKVNAAVCVTTAFQHYQPTLVINIGASGGVHTAMNIGDVVLATEFKYHDADATAFGYQHGQIPRMPTHYTGADHLVQHLLSHQSELPFQLYTGLVTCSDSFIANENWRLKISTNFPDVLALDMESCAIAQSCHLFDVPFLCIRGISDKANDAAIAYQDALAICLSNASIMLKKVLEHIQ